ncbi:MAG: hypothetical protein A2Y25_06440 [Candidatus Melainabacteria bacterium GWF2_37_15]|nr:MAG: hypothetical protein A2Y25_06440 [Candidatus Melainabacteria bacterium GWF2_37_15]
MKRFYHKVLSFFSGLRTKINTADIKNFDVRFKDKDFLERPDVTMNELNPTYVLIRNLVFHPEIKLNIMQSFKSLLKWNELNLYYSVVLRNYFLGFEANTNKFDYSDIHLDKNIRINEEIVQVLPYVRKVNNKKLFKFPFIKRPIHKSYFSREQMKDLKEKIAAQNKTGWTNIEIFEIYDKFHYNFFSNIKQIPGGKELECLPNISTLDQFPETMFYLVIGRKRDTGEPVKAIINPADIKKSN